MIGLRNLSEAIILQSIEDLWNRDRKKRRESFAFFLGMGFSIFSNLASITVSDRRILLSLIGESLQFKKAQDTHLKFDQLTK